MSEQKSLSQIANENSDDYVLEIRVKDPLTNLNRYFQDQQLLELKDKLLYLVNNKFEIILRKEQ